MSRKHGVSPTVDLHLEPEEVAHIICALRFADDMTDEETSTLVTYIQNKHDAHQVHQAKLKAKATARDARAKTLTVEARARRSLTA